MADGPNPQRVFYEGRYLPKVFIAYPHKPTVYEQLAPPDNPAGDEEVWRRHDEEVVAHELAAEREARDHEEAVRRFAEFLHSQSVAVAYDQLVRDAGTSNILRWCQRQIEDSDYLIIVATPSLCGFLDGLCPADMEPLFSSDYLFNLIHGQPRKKDGSRLEIIPVFLGRPKNSQYVPVALRGGSMYEVSDGEFREPLGAGLTSLLCRLTDQDIYQPPPPGRQIVIEPRPRRFGPKRSPAGAQETVTPPAPPQLLRDHRPLDLKTLSKISEQSRFSQQWRRMAPHLGLSAAEVEQCQGKAGQDESEACLQMLRLSAQRCNGSSLTPAALADALQKSGCSFLYDILQSAL